MYAWALRTTHVGMASCNMYNKTAQKKVSYLMTLTNSFVSNMPESLDELLSILILINTSFLFYI